MKALPEPVLSRGCHEITVSGEEADLERFNHFAVSIAVHDDNKYYVYAEAKEPFERAAHRYRISIGKPKYIQLLLLNAKAKK